MPNVTRHRQSTAISTVETSEETCSVDDEAADAPRNALLIALVLNVGLAAGLFLTGLLARSSGLLANGLDNTSDAAVYGISLFAMNRGEIWRVRAAQLSGVMLLVLAVGVLFEVIRRFFSGAEPIGSAIIVMSIVAAAINILSLKVLSSHRGASVNLRAAWTFSVNDLLSNFGLLIAGLLVMLLDQSWPDLVIGLAIALIATKGGIETLLDARNSRNELEQAT